MEHQTTSDNQLVKTMSLVMGVLVLFFLVIVVAANLIVEPTNTSPNSAKLTAIEERTAPVGSVRTSAEEVDNAGAATAVADAAPKTGEQLAAACMACHSAATAAALGAPAIGDAAAWGDRLSAGLDALVSSAINGKGTMPPRGGSTLSDDEIRLAVEFLAGQ